MSILHSTRTSWAMLAIFTVSASMLFLLAVEQDMGLIPSVFRSGGAGTVSHEIRRVINRGEERIVEMEHEFAHRAGEALEHAGQQLQERSGVDTQAAEPPPPAAVPASVAQKPAADIPGRVLTHDFSLMDQGLQATFVTDRPVPEPRIFFIAEPARWVVDVPGSWVNTARYNNAIAEGFISRVVLGEHENYLRVVFHFRDTGRARTAKAPQVTRQDNGFAILVAAPER
ncbi:AMIN domain-containing protein [Desulfonatronum parangueonense]